MGDGCLAGGDGVGTRPMRAWRAMDTSFRVSGRCPNQWPKRIRLLREGCVDESKIITRSSGLSDIEAGIRQVVARDDGVIKIIVKP